MPNIKSAEKRVRTSLKRAARNKSHKSRLAGTRKKFLNEVANGDKAAALKAFNEYCSTLDKVAQKGVIKSGNADRKKARASKKLASI